MDLDGVMKLVKSNKIIVCEIDSTGQDISESDLEFTEFNTLEECLDIYVEVLEWIPIVYPKKKDIDDTVVYITDNVIYFHDECRIIFQSNAIAKKFYKRLIERLY